MPLSIRAHFEHHKRFYTAAALGLLVWTLTRMFNLPVHLAVAGDTFFGVYLLSMLGMAHRATPSEMRTRAAVKDEGITLIVLMTLAAIGLSVGSIFALLNEPGKPDTSRLVLSVTSVPLGWTMLHTVMAFHYGHLFYGRHPSEKGTDAGGLGFPDTQEPGSWDFLYYSFVVGMTAQVSDVQVLSTAMRRVTLAHGVVSFFYNTVLLALAVNVAIK